MKTLTQAAQELGVKPSTLSHQVRAGRLRVRRYGSAVMVSDKEIERYRVESLGRPGRRTKVVSDPAQLG